MYVDIRAKTVKQENRGVESGEQNVTKNHPRAHAILFLFEFATWKQHTGLKSEEPKNKLELQRTLQNG